MPTPDDHWRKLLPALTGLPLLPCGAGADHKAPIDPTTGRQLARWQHHSYDPAQISSMPASVACVGMRLGPNANGLIAFDPDGSSALEAAVARGCDPASASTWRIHRTTSAVHLKLIFRVPPDRWALLRKGKGRLVTKAARPGEKGEQLEVFWTSGQVIVLGDHVSSGGQYIWQGSPHDIAPIPDAWWELALELLSPKPPAKSQNYNTKLTSDDLTRAQSALNYLDPDMSHDTWVQIGMALHDADPIHGIDVWNAWSANGTKYTGLKELEQRWKSFKPSAGVTIATLFSLAQKSGWINPSANNKQSKSRQTVKQLTNEKLSPDPDPDPSPAPFTCLGFDGDGYFYQPGATGQVIRISASGHTGLNLCRLASLAYWEALFPGRSGVAWTAAASSLFTQQARVGVYDPDRIRGRGAWWDQGRSVLHLGDHLVVDGQRHDLTQGPLPRSRFLYQRLPAIEPLDATPLNDLEAFEILDLASRFSWEVQASGTLLAGWVALAPICGVLDWRPHAWLTAAPGSGKSEILKKYIDPLLGDISYWPLGSTTEANIRQSLRYDGIPVVYDESESEERSDKARVQSIIALARVASSSGRGVIGRGSADGHAQNFTMRSMFLLSSVSTALKHGADKTRFANLSLRNPSEIPQEQRSAHWKNLKADLERIITKQSGRRFQARIVNLIPVIRQSAIIFKTAAGEYFRNQRQGDQYGTLLAGAWALQSSKVPSALQAMDCLQGLDWEPYQQATEHSDELACLQTLLEHQLRIESRDGALTRTVAELVSIAARRSPSLQIEPGVAEDLLGRNGFRVDGDCLLISNTATAIARILSVTPWASCWAQTLSRVHGATRPGPSRFKGIGLCRCVGIPLSTVTV